MWTPALGRLEKEMKKRILKILSCIIIVVSILGIKKVISILDDAKIQKYDANGNEIYYKASKNSSEIFRKYNEKNQLIETKNVLPSNVINKEKKSEYTYYEYENDLLVKTIYKSASSSEEENYEIIYEYNDKGLKIKESHSRKGVTFFEYDDTANLIKKIMPDKTIIYEYDKNGKCIKEESSDGNITEYEYDENGRPLRTKTTDDVFFGNITLRWEYFDDDSEISVKYYHGDLNYIVMDKNNEYIEYGWKLPDGSISTTKYKKITLYTRWKNGQIKSKRVYTLYRKEYFEKIA